MLTLFTGYSPVFTSLCIFIHLHFHRCISLSIYKSDCLYLTYVSGSLCLSVYLLCCLPNHSTVCLLVSVCLLLSLTSRVSLAPSPSSRSPSSIHTGIAFLLSSSASLPLSFYSLYFSFPSSFPPPPTSFSPSSSTLFPFLPSCPPSRPSSHTKHFPSPPQQGGGVPSFPHPAALVITSLADVTACLPRPICIHANHSRLPGRTKKLISSERLL